MDRTTRQVWPGTWEHKIKCFWGRILSQINLKGRDGRVSDIFRSGIRKACSYLARAPPAGRHSELRLLVSFQSKQNCSHSTEKGAELGGWALCKAHKKSKRCGRRPNHNLRPSGHGSLQSDKLQAGWKDWTLWLPLCRWEVETLGGKRPCYRAQPRKGFLSYSHVYKSWLSS